MKRSLLVLSLLSIISATTKTIAQVNLTSGLILYLPFNGNANDASGNAHNGAVTAATLTTDKYGHPNAAYLFDGTGNAYITVPNAPDLTPPQFTICATVDLQGFYNGHCYNNMIITKGYDRDPGSYALRTTQTLTDNCFTQDTTKHNYRCDVQNISITVPNMNTQPYLVVNNWDNIVGTYNGDTVKVYVNGVLRYKYKEPNFSVNTKDIFIGRSDVSFTHPFAFNGKIDEIRIYNRVINQQEIIAYGNYNPLSVPTENTGGEFGLQINPNPVKNILDLSYNLHSTQDVTITVFDITGKNIINERRNIVAGDKTQHVDVSMLTPGMYMVQLNTGDQRLIKKFIKQ